MMTFQGLVISSLLFIPQNQAFLLVLAATLIGFNYGTNLSLFPSATKDYFGLKHFGANYGLVFSAWGVGGFIFPRVSQMIVAKTGSSETAYIMAAFFLFLAAGMTFLTRAPRSLEERATVITELEPGRVYSGFFVYRPELKEAIAESGVQAAAEGTAAGPKPNSLRLVRRLFPETTASTRKSA
jgi:hypothetical protein